MPYYEYEYMIEDINQISKEQEEQNKRQQEDMASMRKSMNPSNMMKGMPNMSMPKMSIPKF